MPHTGICGSGERGGAQVAAEGGARRRVGGAGEIAVGQGAEEEFGFLAAARRKEAGVAPWAFEPAKRQGAESGMHFRADVVDGERLAVSADEGAVGAEAFGPGVAAPKETLLDSIALESGGEFLARGRPFGIGRRGVEVERAYLVEVQHRRTPSAVAGRGTVTGRYRGVPVAEMMDDRALDEAQEVVGFPGVRWIEEGRRLRNNVSLVELCQVPAKAAESEVVLTTQVITQRLPDGL